MHEKLKTEFFIKCTNKTVFKKNSKKNIICKNIFNPLFIVETHGVLNNFDIFFYTFLHIFAVPLGRGTG